MKHVSETERGVKGRPEPTHKSAAAAVYNHTLTNGCDISHVHIVNPLHFSLFCFFSQYILLVLREYFLTRQRQIIDFIPV